MDEDVLTCVLGDYPASRIVIAPATFAGYRKARLPHETYPMLVPEADSIADGVLLHGLNKKDLDRIVFFEGEEYELSPCQVRLSDKTCAEALFFDEGIMPLAETEVWDYRLWVEQHKDYMLRQSRVYMSLYGKMSAAEADVHWQTYVE